MKNIITKIITAYVIVAALVLVLKAGDASLAKASTNNTPDQCGVNNGWVWNGSQCVNTCDQNHPWDSVNQRCFNGNGYYGYYGYQGAGYVPGSSNFVGNCSAYGSNFYWNGLTCAQIVSSPTAVYTGNPFNGGYTTPVYNTTSVNNVYNGYNYINYNGYNDYNYVSYVPVNTNTCNSCNYVNPSPKVVTTYYIYTTTTTSNPNYYSYNYPNYTYLGSNNYYNNYWDCDYYDYSNVGYYDIYGNYHF